MRMTDRRELKVKRITINIFFLLIFIVVIVLATSNVSAKKEFISKTITVESSDSLWSLASDISSSTNGLNIQQIIYDIKEINGLYSSEIYIGQDLKLPIY